MKESPEGGFTSGSRMDKDQEKGHQRKQVKCKFI